MTSCHIAIRSKIFFCTGATWGKYDEQLKTKDRLLEENEVIKVEKKQLMAQLEKEQGNMSQYHDKQAKATAAIAALEVELANTQDALVQKEQSRQEATADKKLLEQEVVAVKKDIDDVDMGETPSNICFVFLFFFPFVAYQKANSLSPSSNPKD